MPEPSEQWREARVVRRAMDERRRTRKPSRRASRPKVRLERLARPRRPLRKPSVREREADTRRLGCRGASSLAAPTGRPCRARTSAFPGASAFLDRQECRLHWSGRHLCCGTNLRPRKGRYLPRPSRPRTRSTKWPPNRTISGFDSAQRSRHSRGDPWLARRPRRHPRMDVFRCTPIRSFRAWRASRAKGPRGLAGRCPPDASRARRRTLRRRAASGFVLSLIHISEPTRPY